MPSKDFWHTGHARDFFFWFCVNIILNKFVCFCLLPRGDDVTLLLRLLFICLFLPGFEHSLVLAACAIELSEVDSVITLLELLQVSVTLAFSFEFKSLLLFERPSFIHPSSSIGAVKKLFIVFDLLKAFTCDFLFTGVSSSVMISVIWPYNTKWGNFYFGHYY